MTDTRDKLLLDLREAEQKRQAVLDKIARLENPIKIPRSDSAAISANLAAISAGFAIVVDDVHVRHFIDPHEKASFWGAIRTSPKSYQQAEVLFKHWGRSM